MNLYRLSRRLEDHHEWQLVTKRNSRAARIYSTLGDAKRAKALMGFGNYVGTRRWTYRIERAPIAGWEVVDG